MFRNVEIALIAFYVASVAFFVGGIYFIHQHLGIEQWGIIAFTALMISIGIGKSLSKMAITPLKEHFNHLEAFSKETLHELNLPINTITANTAMLRKTHTDEKSLKRLDRIEQATQMLQERYNELDYLIKKQMERESIEKVNIALIIQERLQFLNGLYPNVDWRVHCEETWVKLDPIGLGKVIDNLVDNGVKYSSQMPKLEITLKEGILTICDWGIGMDELTLMHIYDRYYQNDTAMAGFGIGLHLVKRYCDRHHIALQVHSKPLEGTCVRLEFKTEEIEYGK